MKTITSWDASGGLMVYGVLEKWTARSIGSSVSFSSPSGKVGRRRDLKRRDHSIDATSHPSIR